MINDYIRDQKVSETLRGGYLATTQNTTSTHKKHHGNHKVAPCRLLQPREDRECDNIDYYTTGDHR